ncbi:MAG TPA: hypothetical protein VF623_02845 [Segetibacter sp.]
MKQLAKGLTLKSMLALFMIALIQTSTWAQEQGSGSSTSGSGSTTTTTKSLSVSSDAGWYTSPWVWVIGAVVFILLLVALMRGGSKGTNATTASRTDRVTVTKSSTIE